MKQLEDEFIQKETQLEDKVAKKEQSIRDLKLKLIESEKQLKALRNKNEKMKTEQRNKDTIFKENQTSGTLNPNIEETIVFLKEKLENQKRSIEDHARHLAHRSYQSEAMLADIEERKIKSLETLYPQKNIEREHRENTPIENIEAPKSNKTTYSRELRTPSSSGSVQQLQIPSLTVLETGTQTKFNWNADEKQFVEINRKKSISVRESVNDNTNATPALECIRLEQLM
ncbi:hypothetical protein HHI36_014767 [Cryptolaemus montrouzieri]|uniref:Uncharacterized protein n=1 Tax=Cryptolaemus montrouzieri TaxID=559131 RepID=A0ABD2N3P8_9CUCU